MYHTEITDAFLLKHINKPEAIIEKFKDSAVGYTYTKLISTIKPLALNNDANGITLALTEYHNSLVARKTA
jgi:hypothetical protein